MLKLWKSFGAVEEFWSFGRVWKLWNIVEAVGGGGAMKQY